jgi:hypothetical protein
MLLLAVVAKGEIVQVVVADDLFQLCVRPEDPAGAGPESLLLRAVYRAARAWAGQEEVARGRLVGFLYDALPGAQAFMPVRCPAGLPAARPGSCLPAPRSTLPAWLHWGKTSCLHGCSTLSTAQDG